MYQWAYLPLLGASAALGVAAIVGGRGSVPWFLTAALCAIAAGAGIQLLPLSERTIAAISPNSLTIHQQRELLAASGATHAYTLTIDRQQTELALGFLAAFSLLLIGGVRLLTRHTASLLATAISTVGVILAIIALVQRATFAGRIYGFWELRQGGTPFGPFVNRNHFAGWMLMALPLTIGLLARTVSRDAAGAPASFRQRLIWFATPEANKAILAGFAVLLMTMALVLTLSRSGIAAMACAMAFASVMITRRPGSRRQRLLVPLYLAVVLVIVLMWVGLDRIAGRFAAPGLIDSTGRRAIWSAAGRMVEDFWLAGTGLNTFGIASLYYQAPFAGVHVREAHNDYLQLAAEGGVLLGMPILAAVVAVIGGIRRRLAVDQGSVWWVRVGAVTGLLAVAGQSLVEFSLQIPANAALFTVLCAIALHDSGRRIRPEIEARDAEPPSPQRRSSNRSEISSNKVVEISAGDRPLSLLFDQENVDQTAANREVELSSLNYEPQPERRPAKFPFRAAKYYEARRSKEPHRSTLGVAAVLILLLFFMILLGLLTEGAPLK